MGDYNQNISYRPPQDGFTIQYKGKAEDQQTGLQRDYVNVQFQGHQYSYWLDEDSISWVFENFLQVELNQGSSAESVSKIRDQLLVLQQYVQIQPELQGVARKIHTFIQSKLNTRVGPQQIMPQSGSAMTASAIGTTHLTYQDRQQMQNITNQKFYHPNMDSAQAQNALRGFPPGSYLLRPAGSQGSFAIDRVKSDGTIGSSRFHFENGKTIFTDSNDNSIEQTLKEFFDITKVDKPITPDVLGKPGLLVLKSLQHQTAQKVKELRNEILNSPVGTFAVENRGQRGWFLTYRSSDGVVSEHIPDSGEELSLENLSDRDQLISYLENKGIQDPIEKRDLENTLAKLNDNHLNGATWTSEKEGKKALKDSPDGSFFLTDKGNKKVLFLKKTDKIIEIKIQQKGNKYEFKKGLKTVGTFETIRDGILKMSVANDISKNSLKPLMFGEIVLGNQEKYLEWGFTRDDLQSSAQGASKTFSERRSEASKGIEIFGDPNDGKNRYSDILPAKHSRVTVGEGNYINANVISIAESVTGRKIIAAQGPNDLSLQDHVQMLQEQKADVVILGKDREGQKEKFRDYRPSRNKSVLHQKFEIINENQGADQKVLWDQLGVKNRENGAITHHKVFQIQEFDDYNTTDPKNIYDSIVLLDKKTAKNKPLAVHCSAGVGRTGTWIACYVLSKMLEQMEPADPIQKKTFYASLSINSNNQANLLRDLVISQIRKDRVGSVQTENQENLVTEYIQYFANQKVGEIR